MVRDIRIKNYQFSITASGPSTGSHYSDHPINGEILAVHYVYGSQGATGSISLAFSGTGENFFVDLGASGALTQVRYPYVTALLNDGTIPNGSQVFPYVGNDTIVLKVGSALSGTTPVSVNVLYR